MTERPGSGKELCGHLISGDPDRPCVLKLGHKARDHRDAKSWKKIQEYQRKWTKERREKVEQYKLERGCENCGYRADPVALDLDHRDPTTKITEVSRMISNGAPWERVLAELEKCRILCANCHRIKTHRRPVLITIGQSGPSA